ncbi:MAG: hypothetical protein JSR44_16395 [Spirochaetes bacterium]|nr:hypothetical protein [Spirochaetota bacterium]
MTPIELGKLQHFFIVAALGANALLFVFALYSRPHLKNYLLLFSSTTLLDTLIVGNFIPIAGAETQAALAYFLMLVRDLRFIIILAFLVYAKKSLADLFAFRVDSTVIKPAFIFSLFATLIVTAIGFAKPDIVGSVQNKRLAYELIFSILTLLWIFIVLPQKNIGTAEDRFMRLATLPIFLSYGLAAVGDLALARSLAWGELLRFASNIISYCGYLWWIWYIARGL